MRLSPVFIRDAVKCSEDAGLHRVELPGAMELGESSVKEVYSTYPSALEQGRNACYTGYRTKVSHART